MNKPPAYQWYVKEWLSSPTRLSMCKSARSAYRDLLDYLWDSGECRLPDDMGLLQKMADCTAQEWTEFGAQVMNNFIADGEGFVTNVKMKEVWKERMSFIRMASRRGRAGGNALHKKHALSMHETSSASASASASINLNLKPHAKPARAVQTRSEADQRKIVGARDTRLAKEQEARKELTVGIGPKLSEELRELARKKAL